MRDSFCSRTMYICLRWRVFLAFLVCALAIASGDQRSDSQNSNPFGSTRNESRGEESKWQMLAKEFQLVWGKMQYFFTNDIPDFFNKDTSDNVNNFAKKEISASENVIEEIENTVKTEIKVTRFQDSCQCLQYNCGCCQHLEEPSIHLNSTICANVTYLSQDIGISVTVTVNDYAIFNETVSVRNPPPVCLGIPYVKEFAEACVRFHDIDATRTHFHACAEVEARMKHILIAKYELGCFDIGPITLKASPAMENQHTNEQPSVIVV